MVNSEGQCIIGILTEDLYREKPSDAPNFKKLSASETREYFRDYVGCKELLELAPLPKEGTGHVDLFAKFISNKEIILNRIYDEDLALLKKDDPRLPHLLNVKNHLEDVKATLLARDFQVIDVPLPILNNEMENVFYSFTNSLIVNTAGRKRIIVPQYSTPETPALPTQTGGDSLKKYIAATSVFEKFKTLENTGLYKQNKIQDYLKKKELQTAEVLKMHGFDEVIFIPSLDLIRHGGSLHCVTMEVPAI